MFRKQSVNGVSQLANAFPVDNPQFVNPALFANVNKLEHYIPYILRPESV